MALRFGPRRRMVLCCDFSTGFKEPEMVKVRPVVVVVEPSRNRPGLCTVVPLSTTRPDVILPYHHQMTSPSLPAAWAGREVWAKCDMIVSVSCDRLDRILVRENGERKYVHSTACLTDFDAIRRCMALALGLAP